MDFLFRCQVNLNQLLDLLDLTRYWFLLQLNYPSVLDLLTLRRCCQFFKDNLISHISNLQMHCDKNQKCDFYRVAYLKDR